MPLSHEFPTPLILGVVIWCGLGLLGTVIMLAKNAATPGRAIPFALFSLIHALIFGPLFLLMMLMQQGQQQCPHCRSYIPAGAAVCAKCTRSLK